MSERKMTFKAVLSLFLVHLMDNPDKLNIGRAQSYQATKLCEVIGPSTNCISFGVLVRLLYSEYNWVQEVLADLRAGFYNSTPLKWHCQSVWNSDNFPKISKLSRLSEWIERTAILQKKKVFDLGSILDLFQKSVIKKIKSMTIKVLVSEFASWQ